MIASRLGVLNADACHVKQALKFDAHHSQKVDRYVVENAAEELGRMPLKRDSLLLVNGSFYTV